MLRFAICLGVFVAVVPTVPLTGFQPPAPTGRASGQQPVLLSDEESGRTVEVRSGGQVLLRLPMSMPMAWALTKRSEKLLHEIKERKKPQIQKVQGPPKIGGSSVTESRYEIAVNPGAVITAEWVYCYLGSPEKTAQRLAASEAGKTSPEFRPGLRAQDLREGMIYRVRIRVLPATNETAVLDPPGWPHSVLLSGEQFDQTVEVSSGGQVLLQLPMSMPMTWAQTESSEKLLHAIREKKKIQIRKIPGLPKLGENSVTESRYEIAANPGTVATAEWIYCYLGSPEKTAQRLASNGASKTPPDFRPGLRAQDLREGMIYRVKIRTLPAEPTTPGSPSGSR
jgi:hypothetical protein